MWKNGFLGGEIMPEDVHPDLPKDSKLLLHYLTLGMCLNYQRNSYTLWQACTKSFFDDDTAWIFDPMLVDEADENTLRESLLKHKVALQPNKHIDNWKRVSGGIVKFGNGDVREIFKNYDYDIGKIRIFIQDNKKNFPYLAGDKICNYWLFVLLQYTTLSLTNKESLTIAPDTHILKASVKLGLMQTTELENPNAQTLCSTSWHRILSQSSFMPIDIHTPLWLWSRLGFPNIG